MQSDTEHQKHDANFSKLICKRQIYIESENRRGYQNTCDKVSDKRWHFNFFRKKAQYESDSETDRERRDE